MNKNSYKAFPPVLFWIIIVEGWKGVMTIENSPLKKLPPQVAFMTFLLLSFMWSVIFGIAIMESSTAFGISAVGHIVIVTGIFITSLVFNQADQIGEKRK